MRLLISCLPALAALAVAVPASAQNPTRADLERYQAQTDLVRPGLGDDPGLPRGAPFALPQGVQVSSPIVGVSDPSECGNRSVGQGDTVLVCLPLCNTTASPVTVRLPAGLSILSKSRSRYQNGVLIDDAVVVVPPTPCGPGGIPMDRTAEDVEGEGPPPPPQGFLITLKLFCLNESMSPSESGVAYALGVIAADPDLRELLARLTDRELDEDAVQDVQTAIWSITDGRGLTPADRMMLARL